MEMEKNFLDGVYTPFGPECPLTERVYPQGSQTTQQARLIAGIARFWETVDIAKCKKYIGHLWKVVPKIIECNGQATGY